MGAHSADNRYWSDPIGNILRMEGKQDVIATVTDDCTNEELLAMMENLNRPIYVDGLIADNDRLRRELEEAQAELARMRPVVKAVVEYVSSGMRERWPVLRAVEAYRAGAGKEGG